MKTKLLLIACLLGQEAFSQVVIQNPGYMVGPHSESLDLPSQSNRSGGVINYNHYDLNGNSYSGGNRDLTEIDGVIPVSKKYSFKEFVDGHLIYSSGNQSQVVKMNYHLLYEEIQFIDKKGDTLFVSNTDSIAFVRFEKTLYLHDSQNDYLKMISGNSNITLCSQQKLKLHHYTSTINFNVPVEQLILSDKEYYYLVDKEVKYEANKAGFLKAFPKHKQQITTYLRQMSRQGMAIKFYKEDDLVKLMNFCTSLPQEYI